MDVAVIIAVIALAVALPGCIADTLTILAKVQPRLKKIKHRALRSASERFEKEDARRPAAIYRFRGVACRSCNYIPLCPSHGSLKKI